MAANTFTKSQLTGPREKFSVVKYSKYLLSKTNVRWFEIKLLQRLECELLEFYTAMFTLFI